MKARFVDESGVSFFDEISERTSREILIKRYHPLDAEFTLTPSSPSSLSLRGQIDLYRRELLAVPVGPLACPIDDDGRVEVVYRFWKQD